jgi:hypothetical protein
VSSRLSRRRLAVVTAAGLGAVVLVAPSSASADPADTVVLPVHPSAYAATVSEVTGDAGSWAYVVSHDDGSSTIVRHASGGGTGTTDVPGAAVALDLVGAKLGFLSVGTSEDVSAHVLNVSTGADTVVPLAKREFYLGNTSGGLLVGQPQLDDSLALVERSVSGNVVVDKPAGSVPDLSFIDNASLSDATGWAYVAVEPAPGGGPEFHMHIVDVTKSANNDKDLGIADDEPLSVVQTPSFVYWSTFDSISRANRSGSAAGASSRAVPSDVEVDLLAATDSTVMWTGFSGAGFFSSPSAVAGPAAEQKRAMAGRTDAQAEPAHTRWAAAAAAARPAQAAATLAADPASPFFTRVAPGDGTGEPVDVDGGDSVQTIGSAGTTLLAAVGVLAGDAFVDTVQPDGSVHHLSALPNGPAVPYAFDVSPGQLAYSDDREAQIPLFTRNVSVGGGLTVSPQDQRLVDGPALATGVSGDRIAYLTFSPKGALQIVVLHRHKVERTLNVPGFIDAPYFVLSGSRLLITGFDSPGRLVDLTTGASETVPSAASLHGDLLSYADFAGDIFVRDLGRPQNAQNPKQVQSGLCGDFFDCIYSTSVWNNWVSWSSFDSASGDPVVENWRVGSAPVEIPTDGYGGVFADGMFLYPGAGAPNEFDVLGRSLQHLSDAPTTLATLGGFGAFAADDDGVLAWVGTDGALRVGTFAPPAPSGGRVLSTPRGSAFSPNHDGRQDSWSTEVVTDKSLSSWTLSLKNDAGATVRTFSGSGPHGVARISWNGANTAGHPVPDGQYHWTFAGVASDGSGSIHAADGSVPVTGDVVVSRTAPTAVVHAPALASTTRFPRFSLSWGSTATDATYDVRFRERSSAGWGPWHRMLTDAARTSTLFRGRQGHTYHFAARTHDGAGNVASWSASAATAVPYDDFASRLHYSSGWSTDRGDNRHWLGTDHHTSFAGEKVRVRQAGREVMVIGDRCASCGSFEVWLDGHREHTVSTHGAPAVRAVLYHHVFAAGTARHTVRLVALGTAHHARVAIDAIAFVR